MLVQIINSRQGFELINQGRLTLHTTDENTFIDTFICNACCLLDLTREESSHSFNCKFILEFESTPTPTLRTMILMYHMPGSHRFVFNFDPRVQQYDATANGFRPLPTLKFQCDNSRTYTEREKKKKSDRANNVRKACAA